jgi:small subunit ribosomal protein S20
MGGLPATVPREGSVPRIQSAKKQLRKSKAAAERNRAQRSELRTALKKVRAAGTKAEAEKALVAANSLLDRAGRKNLVHRRNAARMKSRLAAAVAARK